MVLTMDVPACFICGTTGEARYRDLSDRLFGVPGEWSILRCEACGLMWLSPRPLPSESSKLYAEYYTHQVESRDSRIRRLRRSVKRSVLASYFGYNHQRINGRVHNLTGRICGALPAVRAKIQRDTLYLRGEQRGRLLDVGSGDGSFMVQMRELGWTVYGVEPDAKAAEVARRTFQCDVHTGSVYDASFESDYFDAITLCHVIEHVPDPIGVLDRCNSFLRPNGMLVLATPNVSGLGHRLLGASWRELDPPRHFVLFTPETLRVCVERAGFEVQRLVSSPRNASQIWHASRLIRTTGKVDARQATLRPRLEAALFRLLESSMQSVSTNAISEEIIIIASKK